MNGVEIMPKYLIIVAVATIAASQQTHNQWDVCDLIFGSCFFLAMFLILEEK